MSWTISFNEYRNLKKLLAGTCSHVKARDRAEAIAAGLGFNSASHLNAVLRKGDADSQHKCFYACDEFENYLKARNIEYVSKEEEDLCLADMFYEAFYETKDEMGPRFGFQVLDPEIGVFTLSIDQNFTWHEVTEVCLSYDLFNRTVDQAIENAVKIMALDPDSLNGWFALLVFLKDHKRHRQMLDVVNEAIEIAERHIPDGFHGEIPRGLGDNNAFWCLMDMQFHVFSQLGMEEEADALGNKIIELDPSLLFDRKDYN